MAGKTFKDYSEAIQWLATRHDTLRDELLVERTVQQVLIGHLIGSKVVDGDRLQAMLDIMANDLARQADKQEGVPNGEARLSAISQRVRSYIEDWKSPGPLRLRVIEGGLSEHEDGEHE